MLKIAVLCSGDLGYKTLIQIVAEYRVLCVLTDSRSEDIISFSKQRSIPCYAGNPRKKLGYEFIKNYDIDVIASINYLFLIEADIINHSKKLTFNIHGSLLPKYRGRTPHVWAIINNEKEAGITAHIIDSGCDTGHILYQINISIGHDDTGAHILSKYAEAYYPLVKKVLHGVRHNTLNPKPQNEALATYFGKRTPDDGLINWNWDSERIRNWVRAQAYPYPGAFTFYNGKKIIIDKVSISEAKTTATETNGVIIELNPEIIINTANGALKLDVIRTENCTFDLGKKFDNENRR